MKRSKFPLFVTAGCLLFLYLPVVILVLNSFSHSRFGGFADGFSLRWYARLFQEKDLWEALSNSLLIGFGATAVSTVLGTLAAFALYLYPTRLQRIHYGLIYVPLIVPDILLGIGLLLFFVIIHLPLGLFSVFIAHVTFCLSYVIMAILARLQQLDFSVIEAAQDLGASGWTIFSRVLLPMISPGIISGALLAFTLSIDDFVITFFVAGKGASTLPLYVYGMIKYGATPTINALSTILLALTFVGVWGAQKFMEEKN